MACGNFHIRTTISDPTLTPNTITQRLVSTGLRIGIIPESTLGDLSPYTVIVKNSSNNIIFQTSSPISVPYGEYLYFIIPMNVVPLIGEVIQIKVISVDNGCVTDEPYMISAYSGGITTTTTTTTTVNVGNVVEKYIHVQPTSNTNGFLANKTYYFKCSSENVSDDACLLEFKSNNDPAKILDKLPIGGTVVNCSTSMDWQLLDTICVSYDTNQLPACPSGLTLLTIVQDLTTPTNFIIGYHSVGVESIDWKLYNSSNSLITSGNSGTLTTATFVATFGTLSYGTYKLTIQATNCSSDITNGTKSFIFDSGGVTIPTTTSTTTVAPTIGAKWMENGGYARQYDINGNLTQIPLTITLSGTDMNVLNATTNFTDTEVREIVRDANGDPVKDANGNVVTIHVGWYRLGYVLDQGDYVNTNNVGWTSGLPTNLTIPADGRVHSIMVGLIGDVWGSDSRTNKMHNLYQIFFRVGGSSEIPTIGGLDYIGYPSTFNPLSNLQPNFFTQIPTFTLTNKLNHYNGAIPRNKCSFDLRTLGFTQFGHYNEATTTFPIGSRYVTDYDGWAKNTAQWQNTNGMNNSNQAYVESLVPYFIGGLTGVGILIRDDEWRQGVDHNENGKLMEYYFFKKAHELSPSTRLFCHHARPYRIKSAWYQGSQTISDVAKPFLDTYTLNNLIDEYVNQEFFGVYWADIAGRTRGDNAGQFLDISVSAYVGQYNNPYQVYAVAQELFVNKKFYPSKKVTAVIEKFFEVSVSQQEGVHVSWKWSNGGEQEILQPMLNPSYVENIALISNFLADGINCWDEGNVTQETNPQLFYSNSSIIGTPTGATGDLTNGRYPKQWHGMYDYVVAGMWKYAQLPSTVISTAKIPDISLDGGTTWLTGENIVPVVLASRKQPMAFYMKANGRTAILCSFPYNAPTRLYNYKVRIEGTVYDVKVCGQYPELIII